MKKGIKFAALTALSISAVAVAPTPQASAAEEVPAGFYDIKATSNGFTSIADFKKLSKAEKQKLFKNENVYIVTKSGVVSAIDGITASNEELKSKTVTVEKFQEDKNVDFKDIASAGVKVTEVSAITTSGVVVTFPELKADIKDATVEVKNSKGEVVAVLAQDLAKGAKSAEFDFTKKLTSADLTGVWTVEGKEYSFTILEKVKEAVSAAKANNQVKLVLTLTDLDIKNVNDEYTAQYVAAIDTADTEEAITTVVELQSIVDVVNAEYKVVAELVEKKDSAVNFFNALKANFERVNSDFSGLYKKAILNGGGTGLATDVETLEDIQTAIDGINTEHILSKYVGTNAGDTDSVGNAAVYTGITGTLDSEGLDEIEELVNDYLSFKGFEAQKEYLLDLIKEERLVIAVNEAESKTAIKKALTNVATNWAALTEKYADTYEYTLVNADLSKNTISVSPAFAADATVLKATDIKDANLDAYIVKFSDHATNGTPAIANKNFFTDVKTLVDTVNTAQAGSVYTKIGSQAVSTATEQEEFFELLEDTGVKRLSEANLDEYVALAPTIKTNVASAVTPALKLAAVQAQVDLANVDAVNNAGSVTELWSTLQVLELNNLVAANRAEYHAKHNVTTADSKKLSDATTTAEVKAVIAKINQDVVQAATTTAINQATTATEVKAALDTTNIVGYANVAEADRLLIAEKLLAERATHTNGKFVDFAAIEGEFNASTAGSVANLYATELAKLAVTSASTGSTVVSVFEYAGAAGFEVTTPLSAKTTKADNFIQGLITEDAFKADGSALKVPFRSIAAAVAKLQ